MEHFFGIIPLGRGLNAPNGKEIVLFEGSSVCNGEAEKK